MKFHRSFLVTVVLALVIGTTGCGAVTPAPTSAATKIHVKTPVPTATFTPTLEPSPTAIVPTNVEKVILMSNFKAEGAVLGVSYLPDGKTLAVTTEGRIYLYDVRTFTAINSFDSKRDEADLVFYPTIVLTSQGDLLALGKRLSTNTCGLALWRFSDSQWQQIGEVASDDPECLGVALSSDGKYLAVVSYAKHLTIVWRTSDMTQVQAFPIEYPGDIYSIFVQLAFSGQDVLAIGVDNFINIYDLRTGALLHHLEEQEPDMRQLHHLAISQDGRVVAARFQSASKILVWHLDNGGVFILDDAEEGWMSGRILLSPNGAYVAFLHPNSSASRAAWIDIWQTSDGSAFARLHWPGWGYAPSMAFSPDSSKLATGGEDGVSIWQICSNTTC